MFSVMKKLTVALAAGLVVIVAGAFAHGDHGAAAPAKVSGCCKSKPAAECAGKDAAKACPAETAALPDCCAKTAAGNKQECCSKHAAGQAQACCEKKAEVAVAAAAPAGCCKAKAAAAANGNMSSNMQNLMQKVDELRKRRQ